MVQAEGTNRVIASQHQEKTISAWRAISDKSHLDSCVKIAIFENYHGLLLAQWIGTKRVRLTKKVDLGPICDTITPQMISG